MTLKWDHWHIEPSSICALKCPRCPRIEVAETLLNRQLTLEFFQDRIGAEALGQIRRITFCGNDGDPIYCRDLIDICAWIKQVNPAISLVTITNGSYRARDWWQQLSQVLDHRDEVHWSLDGWDHDSNSQYRVGSDWHSIMQGVQAFHQHRRGAYTVWDAIAFRFNQDRLDHMEQLAAALGFDAFQLTLSTKFGSRYTEAYGSDDELEPTHADLVSQQDRYQRRFRALTTRPRPAQELTQIWLDRARTLLADTARSGLCLIGNKGVFVNSQGEFYPCCWTANRYQHNQRWHELARHRFNLWQRSLEQVLADEFWRGEFLEFNSQECRTKCQRHRLHDEEHVTQW